MQQRSPGKNFAAKLLLLFVVLVSATGAAPRIINLGSNADVNGIAVTADGTAVLVGDNATTGLAAMWSISTSSVVTPATLTGPAGAPRLGTATGISADGNYIVGSLTKTGSAFQFDGAVWTRTQPTNPTIVPDLSDPYPSTQLRDISNTGLAVGNSGQSAYRWTSSSGGIALPASGTTSAWASAISASGATIVGSANSISLGHPVAVTWNSGAYSVLDSNFSAAYGVSPNGQIVVGASDAVNDTQLLLDLAYWNNGQRNILLDSNGDPITGGQALWATDSGIIGGYFGEAGTDPVEAWIYILGMRTPIAFDTWWKQITGTNFPIHVTSIPAAVEKNGELYLALEGGAYFAQLQWAAPGDGNRDRKVDGADYVLWADNFLKTTGVDFSTGDFNGDGKVDGADYIIWADNFNPGASVAQSLAVVPEPSSALLAVVGGIFAWTAFRRRFARKA